MNAISVFILLISLLFGNPTEKNFVIEGPSMSPTLSDGDRVKVSTNLSTDIVVNDIIIFKQDNKSYCKRVIGVEGDRIEVVGTQILVNGTELYHSKYQIGEDTEITLQQDEFYVIGDNIDNSYDSRMFGPINRSHIIGKVTSIKHTR
ncbi:signal peptidase I [Cohnella caldifontis]|uniref:signal peptidase I n=1 Tax=Cohnella caldifontis TaxID=3027471 RepID=UPI0023EB8D93|nr:signal peptidase I [Cohnella sp. YIM B05605]